MASEGTRQASKVRKQQTVLPSYGIFEPQLPAWHANTKGAAVSHIP